MVKTLQELDHQFNKSFFLVALPFHQSAYSMLSWNWRNILEKKVFLGIFGCACCEKSDIWNAFIKARFMRDPHLSSMNLINCAANSFISPPPKKKNWMWMIVKTTVQSVFLSPSNCFWPNSFGRFVFKWHTLKMSPSRQAHLTKGKSCSMNRRGARSSHEPSTPLLHCVPVWMSTCSSVIQGFSRDQIL